MSTAGQKLVGPMPPLRPSHAWSIRMKPQMTRRTRDLGMAAPLVMSNGTEGEYSYNERGKRRFHNDGSTAPLTRSPKPDKGLKVDLRDRLIQGQPPRRIFKDLAARPVDPPIADAAAAPARWSVCASKKH